MQVDVEQDSRAIILSLKGRVDSAVSKEFEEAVLGSFSDGSRVVMDFSNLDYISSAGLRVILIAAKKLKASMGVLHLCGMKPHIQEVFDISGFSNMISIKKNRTDAFNVL